jgi:membrane protein DedA with SNARE-associated domain
MNRLLGGSPVLFTSSGLGDHLVEGVRRELFDELLAGPSGTWQAAQDAFHRHTWPGREHLSVNMTRATARTVSFTVIDVTPAGALITYHPDAPREHDPGHRPHGQLHRHRCYSGRGADHLPPRRPGPASRPARRPPPLRFHQCAMTSLPLDPGAAAGPWALALGLALAALVSEDLTCVAAGLLVAAARLDWLPAVAACFTGIVLGDAGVWLLGRTGSRWVRWRVSPPRLAQLGDWLGRRGAAAAFVSRVLPGTRLPLLLAAGVASQGGKRFLLWAALAALVWTPLVVLSVAWLGWAVPTRAVLVVFLGVYVAVRLVPPLISRTGRARVAAKVSRVWRWEFWPACVFYLPLVPWFLYLAARYRSLTIWTAANPGIVPAGGVVGESKADVISRLPPEWVVPTLLVPAGGVGDRLRLVLYAVADRGWEFPLILKPDAGERGAGVRKAHDPVDVEKYLLANQRPVIAQPLHPGPFEAGVFYYRLPGEDCGHIFSVTDKVFPAVTGDGRATLEELVWAHARYRMQAATFLARHAADADRVLVTGERFVLATAGNHCQGTLFRDGVHLVTPALEAAFDSVARQFDGFFVGRFDVRYTDPDEFRAGRGFAIVELNGVTSESTNLYDPSWPIWRAYRTLFRQWALLFRIGDANRHRGHRPVSLPELLNLLRAHYRDRTTSPLAD